MSPQVSYSGIFIVALATFVKKITPNVNGHKLFLLMDSSDRFRFWAGRFRFSQPKNLDWGETTEERCLVMMKRM